MVTQASKPLKIDRLEPEKKKGLIVVLTGNGKGKTTSALGMCVRACGHGMRTCIIQFMKGDLYAGEWDGVKKMNCDVELISTGKGFCGIQGNPYPWEEHRANAQDALKIVHEKMESGLCDLVVLDEINNALHLKLVDLDQVLKIFLTLTESVAGQVHTPRQRANPFSRDIRALDPYPNLPTVWLGGSDGISPKKKNLQHATFDKKKP
jgi:cob(I)alamin adenosyltransferase